MNWIKRLFGLASPLDKKKKELENKQWEVAMDGNVQMLIWLGKQHLNQKDKPVDNSWWDRPIDDIEFIDDGKPMKRGI